MQLPCPSPSLVLLDGIKGGLAGACSSCANSARSSYTHERLEWCNLELLELVWLRLWGYYGGRGGKQLSPSWLGPEAEAMGGIMVGERRAGEGATGKQLSPSSPSLLLLCALGVADSSVRSPPTACVVRHAPSSSASSAVSIATHAPTLCTLRSRRTRRWHRRTVTRTRTTRWCSLT